MLDSARRLWGDPQATGLLPDPFDDAAPYLLMSPRFHLPRGGPPTLLMQETLDEGIPEPWTLATTAALQEAGIRAQFVSFLGAMHNFQGSDLIRANRLAIDWLHSAVGH